MDGELAAFAVCIVVGDAVSLSAEKSDPAQLKSLPNNALVYELTRHYLRDRKMAYVTAGSRVMLHQTRFQEFLEGMGYRRIYMPLRVELSPVASTILRLGLPTAIGLLGVGKLAPLINRLNALQALVTIADTCRDIII